MTPRLSVSAPQFGSDPEPLRAAARFCESAGLSGIYAFDHLIPLGRPTGPMFDLVSTLGVLAACTSTISVGSMVARIGLRSDDETMAIGRALKALAGPRALIGLGIGDSMTAEENRRFGFDSAPPAERRRRLETVARRLAGDGIRVVVGGVKETTLDVAVAVGAWNGWGLSVDHFRAVAADLRVRRSGMATSWGGAVMVGNDREDLERQAAARAPGPGVLLLTMPELVSLGGRLADAGAEEIILTPVPNRLPNWERLAAVAAKLA